MKKLITLFVLSLLFFGAEAQTLTQLYTSSDMLNDIAVANDNAIYAVGDKIVVIKDGQTLEYSAPEELFSVFPLSATQAWAVGGQTILSYDGTDWKPEPFLGSGTLYRVWGYDGEVFITGSRNDTAFLLQLVANVFEQKAEMAGAIFLGMNAYSGSGKLYIAGSYTYPGADKVPAVFRFENNAVVKTNQSSADTTHFGCKLERNTYGGFLMNTDVENLYTILGVSISLAPYNGYCRSICVNGTDQLFMANGNGIIVSDQQTLSGGYQTLVTGENVFDIEYQNSHLFILTDRNTIKIMGPFAGIEEIEKNKAAQTGPVELYNLIGQQIFTPIENLPTGIYLRRVGNYSQYFIHPGR